MMTQDQINVTLFDEVKKLQDIKCKHEENELRMAHEIDQLRAALLAMHEHYREFTIKGSLYNQVVAALQIVSMPKTRYFRGFLIVYN